MLSFDRARLSKVASAAVEGLGFRNVKRFRGGLVFKAHRLLYLSTLGLRVINKRREEKKVGVQVLGGRVPQGAQISVSLWRGAHLSHAIPWEKLFIKRIIKRIYKEFLPRSLPQSLIMLVIVQRLCSRLCWQESGWSPI